MRRWSAVLLVVLAFRAAAQAPVAPRRPGANVIGTVHDSIARQPLSGAKVQLVAADAIASFSRSTDSDAEGHFAFSDVPAGSYMIGFFHAMLDSLGLEPPLRQVVVKGQRRVRADLAIPSPVRMRAAICGPRQGAELHGVILGVVRDARTGSPLPEANVTVEWREYVLVRTGEIIARTPQRFAMTTEGGFFALCDVPSPGELVIMASRGEDSTDWVEVQTPKEGFLRRDLYLGTRRTVTAADTSRLYELLPVSRRAREGNGTVRGTVVTALQGRPLEGAVVSILDGPETRTNERGEWTLVNVPSGTRRLLVRAVGYYPAQLSVDVVAATPPVHVSLSTLKAVLDTVKITARRIADRYRGFEDRIRSGAGRYIRDEEIARWRPIHTSDVFKFIPGVRVVHRELESILVLRGAIADTSFADSTASAASFCQPPVFLDGHNLFTVSLETIDDLVLPREIAAIEIYVGGTVPPQYDDARTGCGAILIWTK